MDDKIKAKGYEKLNPGKRYADYIVEAYGPIRAREMLKKPVFTIPKKQKEEPLE